MWIFNARNDEGLTLIELLMVLVLSSVIIEGLFTVYLHTKEHHIQNNALQEITEEMRFMDQLFERGIRGAGYLGLATWEKIVVYDSLSQKILENSMIILEEQDESLSENIRNKIKYGTQAIELRQMDFSVTSLTEKANLNQSEIIVDTRNSAVFKKDDIIIIADLYHAEINKIIAIQKLSDQKQSIQLENPLHDDYEKNAYIGAYLDKIYFIGDTGQFFPNKEKIYGLYMHSENGMTEEITDLVSDMSFQYPQEKTLQISVTLMLPYWVNGKFFSRQEDFIVANRE